MTPFPYFSYIYLTRLAGATLNKVTDLGGRPLVVWGGITGQDWNKERHCKCRRRTAWEHALFPRLLRLQSFISSYGFTQNNAPQPLSLCSFNANQTRKNKRALYRQWHALHAFPNQSRSKRRCSKFRLLLRIKNTLCLRDSGRTHTQSRTAHNCRTKLAY